MQIQYQRDRLRKRKRQAKAEGAFTTKPHEHPSLTCYKWHFCRCPGCTELIAIQDRDRRQLKKERTIPNVLPIEEVHKLRRLLGLNELDPSLNRFGELVS